MCVCVCVGVSSPLHCRELLVDNHALLAVHLTELPPGLRHIQSHVEGGEGEGEGGVGVVGG